MSKKFLLPIIALMSISACSGNNAVDTSISPNQSIINDPVFVDHRLNKPEKTFNSNHQTLDEGYVASLKAFSEDFYFKVNNSDNQIFSPISIATCYSMLYDGALEETKKELKNVLHYDDSFNHLTEIQKMLLNTAIDDPDSGTYLDLAQSLWIHSQKFADRINQDYFTKMQDYYFAEAYQGILESKEMHKMLADYINAKTHNFLNVKEDDFKEYGGVLWLLNTIYLKAKWSQAFPLENDMSKLFHNLDGTTTRKDFMVNDVYSSYYKADNYMISTLPYYKGLSMTILLPNEGVDYAKVLNDKSAISAMVEYYNTRNHMPATITYQIPKFKTQVSYDLTEVMPKLGAVLCFDDNRANLFGLVTEPAKGLLYVERSKHEAGIEVNNDGTEAAAYTIIEIDEKAAMPHQNEVTFICDRPFAYIINTSDGLPLFMGTVNKF